jgi:flagellar motor switch protein FliN/FliY
MAEKKGVSPGDATPAEASVDEGGPGLLGQDEIEALLNQTQAAVGTLAEADRAAPQSEPLPKPFQLVDLKAESGLESMKSLDLLRDVDLNLQIELGRTQMIIEDVLRLRKGSVVALDKLAGDPVDIYANGHLLARGEVLVLNENFCVRITEIVSPSTKVAVG